MVVAALTLHISLAAKAMATMVVPARTPRTLAPNPLVTTFALCPPQMIGLGCGRYFVDNWNKFDFFIVLVSQATLLFLTL